MVGLHAQVMSSAELQAAVRIDGLRAADVRDALWERRRLVKVWAFRQTLHLLTPDDLADFVVAARSLERWHTPAWLRYFKLSARDVGDLIEAVGAVLTDRPMTRADLAAAVTERVRKPRLREAMLTGWGTFLAPAAQRGHLVFGPSDGRNVAFVDPSTWLGRRIAIADDPAAADEALGRLIGRYLAVFPGASREMIARWWGGGRMTAVNRALGTGTRRRSRRWRSMACAASSAARISTRSPRCRRSTRSGSCPASIRSRTSSRDGYTRSSRIGTTTASTGRRAG